MFLVVEKCITGWKLLKTSCRSPKPLVVEMLEPRDEDDGLAERMIQRSAMLQKYSF